MAERMGPVKFEGTPREIGGDVFVKLCMPIIREAQKSGYASEKDLAQMYAGFIGAALGSLAAEFGQELAVVLGRRMVDTFAALNLDQEAPNARH